ncbi:MAG: metallophosphoesterase, partial [Clostridia bacterium]|nr:metallophosphoesterase [Clostridia bacterium]
MIFAIIFVLLLANILACYLGYKAFKSRLWFFVWFIVVWGLTAIPFLHLFGLMPEWGEKYWLIGGYSWLIGVFYLDFFIILINIIFLLIDPKKSLSGCFWLKAFVICILMAVFFGTGAYLAQVPKIMTYEIEMDKENSELKKLNLLMISDLHLGLIEDQQQLAKWVHKINALQPQLICICGDVLNDGFREIGDPQGFQQELARLSAPCGVYACLGNHDLGQNTQAEIAEWFQGAGVQLLRDEYVETAGLIVAGLDYKSNWQSENTASLDFLSDLPNPNQPVILLEHNPARLAEQGEADLILAGHTHRGQVFPLNLITRHLF